MSLLGITRTCPDSISSVMPRLNINPDAKPTQNAHAEALASIAASLALPAGATERVLVYSRDLYCYKFALEDSKTLRGDL